MIHGRGRSTSVLLIGISETGGERSMVLAGVSTLGLEDAARK